MHGQLPSVLPLTGTSVGSKLFTETSTVSSLPFGKEIVIEFCGAAAGAAGWAASFVSFPLGGLLLVAGGGSLLLRFAVVVVVTTLGTLGASATCGLGDGVDERLIVFAGKSIDFCGG